MKYYHANQKITMYSQTQGRSKNLQEETECLNDAFINRKDAGKNSHSDGVDTLKDGRGVRRQFFSHRQKLRELHNTSNQNTRLDNAEIHIRRSM